MIEQKAQAVATQLSYKSSVGLDPAIIAAIIVILTEIIQLLRGWWYSPQSAVDNLENPGILTKWLINRALKNNLPVGTLDVSKENIKDAIKSVARYTTANEMQIMYSEV